MLQFQHVAKSYNGETILEIPTLVLEKGIYWLQGINGSGKTTILRMLAGLIPFTGEIHLKGINLRENPKLYRQIVNFGEAEPLYPDFITGTELVNFYREIRLATEIQTDMLVELFKMHSFISHPVGSYSSGMVKKLSLLLAFIGKPALILLDEPLATLDEFSMQKLPGLISAYYKEFGTTFIYSSHQSFKSDLPVHNMLVSDQSLQLSA
jgi:ABC-2 type transport system ATP-binding protein